jgi:hypothetical protein
LIRTIKTETKTASKLQKFRPKQGLSKPFSNAKLKNKFQIRYVVNMYLFPKPTGLAFIYLVSEIHGRDPTEYKSLGGLG